jgi:hypothetical protein
MSTGAATKKGGMRRFALQVLALLVAIVALIALARWLSGDTGIMPFQYEGMD